MAEAVRRRRREGAMPRAQHDGENDHDERRGQGVKERENEERIQCRGGSEGQRQALAMLEPQDTENRPHGLTAVNKTHGKCEAGADKERRRMHAGEADASGRIGQRAAEAQVAQGVEGKEKERAEAESRADPSALQEGKEQYRRSDHSLHKACSVFFERFGKGPSGAGMRAQSIPVQDVAAALRIHRRRVYDLMNVLEGVGIVTRSGKNTYLYAGLSAVAGALVGVSERSDEFFDALVETRKDVGQAVASGSGASNALEVNETRQEMKGSLGSRDNIAGGPIGGDDTPASSATPQPAGKVGADSRRKRSLGQLTVWFVSVFLRFDDYQKLLLEAAHRDGADVIDIANDVGYVIPEAWRAPWQALHDKKKSAPRTLVLNGAEAEASNLVRVQLHCTKSMSSPDRPIVDLYAAAYVMQAFTKVRRLYDVANILCACELLVKNLKHFSRKPAYQWNGPPVISLLRMQRGAISVRGAVMSSIVTDEFAPRGTIGSGPHQQQVHRQHGGRRVPLLVSAATKCGLSVSEAVVLPNNAQGVEQNLSRVFAGAVSEANLDDVRPSFVVGGGRAVAHAVRHPGTMAQMQSTPSSSSPLSTSGSTATVPQHEQDHWKTLWNRSALLPLASMQSSVCMPAANAGVCKPYAAPGPDMVGPPRVDEQQKPHGSEQLHGVTPSGSVQASVAPHAPADAAGPTCHVPEHLTTQEQLNMVRQEVFMLREQLRAQQMQQHALLLQQHQQQQQQPQVQAQQQQQQQQPQQAQHDTVVSSSSTPL